MDVKMERKWMITKWCKTITDDNKDWYVNKDKDKSNMNFRFRLLDDDNEVYAYGVCVSNDSFAPLSAYREDYGVTSIQYKNKETGKYETL